MQRYIFFLKRPLPKLRNYLPLLQNCVRLNPEIISSFLVRISFTSPLHILPPFHNPIPPIPDGIHQRSYTPKPLIDGTRQKSSGLQPLEPSAPRTDQPPARGGRLVCLSCRTIILWASLRHKHIPTKLPHPFQNPSKHAKAHTFSKKVSGRPGSNTSLQYITVTKSSVSERLMMLCV